MNISSDLPEFDQNSSRFPLQSDGQKWSKMTESYRSTLKTGNTVAHFSSLAVVPEIMFLLIRAAICRGRLFAASLIIFGPRPSSPVASGGSKM